MYDKKKIIRGGMYLFSKEDPVSNKRKLHFESIENKFDNMAKTSNNFKTNT